MTNPDAVAVHDELFKEFEVHAATAQTPASLMERIARRLHEKVARSNWVGFYVIELNDSAYLQVGPFFGRFTPKCAHSTHKGLCGAAARSGKTVVEGFAL